MKYRIRHITRYRYSEPVAGSHHAAHMRPRDEAGAQICRRWHLDIQPYSALYRETLDFFSNPVAFFTVQEEHEELVIEAGGEVVVLPPSIPDSAVTPAWENVASALRTPDNGQALDACQFAYGSPFAPLSADLADYAEPSFSPGRPILDAVLDLTRRIHADFRYQPETTSITTPVSEVLRERRGVCQDFAHLQLACLRSKGIAARYVSGYLRTFPPPGKPRLEGADASHAWVAVFIPGFGWVDLDPTNNMIPRDTHVTLAWGRDYGDVSPIRGVLLGGGEHEMTVAVDVEPLGGDED